MNVRSIFSGYPDEQIARWCLVKPATVRNWKRGKTRPSKRAVKLFTLHASGRVLIGNWRGWRITNTALYDPAGKAFKRTEMEIHSIVYQIASYCRQNHMPKKKNLWDEISEAGKK